MATITLNTTRSARQTLKFGFMPVRDIHCGAMNAPNIQLMCMRNIVIKAVAEALGADNDDIEYVEASVENMDAGIAIDICVETEAEKLLAIKAIDMLFNTEQSFILILEKGFTVALHASLIDPRPKCYTYSNDEA